jgi:hypothetical protein
VLRLHGDPGRPSGSTGRRAAWVDQEDTDVPATQAGDGLTRRGRRSTSLSIRLVNLLAVAVLAVPTGVVIGAVLTRDRHESITFAPEITSDCHAFAAPAPDWFTPPQGHCERAAGGVPRGMWLFTATNEDRLFTGGTMHDIAPSEPVWTHDLRAEGDGSYSVLLGLDKTIPSSVPSDAYSFVGFNDSLDINRVGAKPTVGDGLVLRFDLRILDDARDVSPNPAVGEARTRFVVGVVARDPDDDVSHYLEVNLTRSSNFDLCTAHDDFPEDAAFGPCDELGVYDRRARWTGDANGELVTVDIDALGERFDVDAASPQPSAAGRHIRLPVTRLFESVSWVSEPAGDAEIAGVYIGTEIWGPGRTMMQIDDYELFRQ